MKVDFAAAVGADETVAVTAAEFDGDVFEQRLAPNCMVMLAVEIKDLPINVCGGVHRRSGSNTRRSSSQRRSW